MTNKDEVNRREFETYLRSIWTQGYGCAKNDEGKYHDGNAQSLWECWQASRAAVQADAAPSFEAWATKEGLIGESHGVRFVNSQCDVARKAWDAATIPEGYALVPVVMTAAMINAWADGRAVSTDEVAARTPFQDAWKRVLTASGDQS
ncbi:hypothetical protein [Paraburkholderia atlantica]|uniref:hypothetical protein n=1 Tax=Paraburkholderia atlantica TaxID=2654982 RepID=UPI00160E4F31|nr:hypothetical protein [Paraburkholderia atlantica]MBB5414048.1 hypothetical protein [Paraburkholderia atlantica]